MAYQWNVIKERMIEEIKPVFDQEKSFFYTPACSFEVALEAMRSVFTKRLNLQELDESNEVLEALSARYVDERLSDVRYALSEIVGDLEFYLKRLFTIIDGTYYNEMLATCFKRFFSDFNYFNRKQRDAFFDQKESEIRNKPFAIHLMRVYHLRNSKTHSNPKMTAPDVYKNLESSLVVYLYITMMYYEKLCPNIDMALSDDDFNSCWAELTEACHHFNKHNSYILVTGPNVILKDEEYKQFANINWSFIFDFDNRTYTDGLMGAVKPLTEKVKAVKPIVKSVEQANNEFIPNTLYWFKARGSISARDSLPQRDDTFSWYEMYSDYMRKLMKEYYSSISINKPITVLILFNNREYLKEVIFTIKTVFNQNVRYVFATDKNDSIFDLIDSVQGIPININFSFIAEGFRQLYGRIVNLEQDRKIYLPCFRAKGRTREIPLEEEQKIRRFFNIVHLNIANDDVENVSDKSFYQGRVITWKELDEDWDIKRDITREIFEEVRGYLSNRSTGVIELYHEPGAGGTTVARRVVMEFYKDYPSLLLHTYNPEAVDEIHKIYEITEQPVFILIDNINITEHEQNELFNLIEKRSIPTVLLVVKKRFNKSGKYYLPLRILASEEERFVSRFSKEFPEFENIFREIKEKPNNKSLLTPFYLGLIVHEEKYISIGDYVKSRMQDMTAIQKNILLYIAFYSYYAREIASGLPSFIFSTYLNEDLKYIILQDAIGNKEILDLIIEADQEGQHWRTLHPLISYEILTECLNPQGVKNKLNVFELEKLSLEFIHLLRNSSTSKNEQILDILRNVFIYRNDEENNIELGHQVDEHDVFDRNFSKLIVELGTKESQIGVLRTLVEKFPTEEPHFRAHLARLYFYQGDEVNYDLAHQEINKAIEVLKSDETRKDSFIFYHIKGIGYRSQAYELKEKYYDGRRKFPQTELDVALKQFRYLFDQAAIQFKETRQRAQLREHGYISYVQFAIQAIEFGYSISPFSSEGGFVQFLTQNTEESLWYQHIFSQANTLLERFKSINGNAHKSTNYKKQNAILKKYFEKPDHLIRMWRSLLSDPKVDPNDVRRNIVNAHLSKTNYQWGNMTDIDLRDVKNLLFENIKRNPMDNDIRRWFEACRRLKISIDTIIKDLRQCEYSSETSQAAYYLAALSSVKAIAGAPQSTCADAKEFIIKSRARSQSNSHVFCQEWVGIEDRSYVLVNHSEIGEWNSVEKFFDAENPPQLARLRGIVKHYEDRKKGKIELLNEVGEGTGIEVFYAPGSANHYKSNETDIVEFFLGFNYFGPRAFKVKDAVDNVSNTKSNIVDCEVLSVNSNNRTIYVKINDSEFGNISQKELGSFKLNRIYRGQKLKARKLSRNNSNTWGLSLDLSLSPIG